MEASEIENHFVKSGKEIRFFTGDVDFHKMLGGLRCIQKVTKKKITILSLSLFWRLSFKVCCNLNLIKNVWNIPEIVDFTHQIFFVFFFFLFSTIVQ